MTHCPIHGFSGCYIHSADLLELDAEGRVPEIVPIEIESGFFRINLSPRIVAHHQIVGEMIPFDDLACDLLETLPEMCGRCFYERRCSLSNSTPASDSLGGGE